MGIQARPASFGYARSAIRPNSPYRVNWQSPQARGLVSWWPILPIAAIGVNTAIVTQPNLVPGPADIASPAVADAVGFAPDSLLHTVALLTDTDVSMIGPVADTLISASLGAMSCWIKILGDGLSSDVTFGLSQIIGDELDGGYFGLRYGNRASAGQKLHAYNWDGDDDFVAATITQNEWHHILWMHAGGNLYLYVDGRGASAVSGNTSFVSGVFTIGSTVSTSANAKIADVRIYNKGLDPATIYQMWDPATRWDLYSKPSLIPWIEPPAPRFILGTH